jgi:hypothetical protein
MEGYPGDIFDDDSLYSGSSTCSSNSNLSARPKGLSSEEALQKLTEDIKESLENEPKSSFKTILKKSFDPSNETSLFPASAVVVGLLQAAFLFVEIIFISTETSESIQLQR